MAKRRPSVLVREPTSSLTAEVWAKEDRSWISLATWTNPIPEIRTHKVGKSQKRRNFRFVSRLQHITIIQIQGVHLNPINYIPTEDREEWGLENWRVDEEEGEEAWRNVGVRGKHLGLAERKEPWDAASEAIDGGSKWRERECSGRVHQSKLCPGARGNKLCPGARGQ